MIKSYLLFIGVIVVLAGGLIWSIVSWIGSRQVVASHSDQDYQQAMAAREYW